MVAVRKVRGRDSIMKRVKVKLVLTQLENSVFGWLPFFKHLRFKNIVPMHEVHGYENKSVPFGESRSGLLIRDSAGFTFEGNAKSEKELVALVTLQMLARWQRGNNKYLFFLLIRHKR